MSVITRYNVRDVAGKMTFSQTEAQKDKIVAAGGSVVNVIKMPGPKPKPPPPPPPTSADDLVLQSRLTGVKDTLTEQLELFAAGEITEEQLTTRKTALEEGHLDWYTEFEKTGATDVEKEQIISARAGESAKQLESTVKQILTMEAEGEISHDQSVAAVKHYQEEQLEEVKDIISGEDVKAGTSGLSLGYTFVEEKIEPVDVEPVVPVTRTITTEVWTVKMIDPDTGKVIKTEKFNNEEDAKTWARYQEMAITRLPVIEEEREAYRELVEKVAPKKVTSVGTVTVDPNLVTYMGITMTRDQFEADFPPDTIPDKVVETAITHVDIGKAYEDAMTVIPDSLRDSSKILGEAALNLAAAGKPVEGFLNYLGGLVYRETAVIYDVATLVVRPELWRQQAQTIGYLLAADKPETRTEHNQRIADLVAADITDPTMQEEVTEFLQTAVPFTPQDQEYLDKAKEFRIAVGKEIARDPFAFALDVGVSFYTGKVVGKFLGNLKDNMKNYGRKKGFSESFIQEQLDKMRPLSEIDDIIEDAHVAAKFKDLPDPEMFRGTDLQLPPDVEAWSADLYSTGRPWTPAYAGKGAYQTIDPRLLGNEPAMAIARDVAAKGGQQVVFLKDPLTNQVAGVMSYTDFIKATKTNPLAFAALGVTITVVEPGGAKSVLDKAVKDGVFDKGFTPTPITQNRILTTIDETTLQTTITELSRGALKDIDVDTMVDVLPKLEPDVISQITPVIGKDLILETIKKLDPEIVVKVIPNLRKDVIKDIVPDLDDDTILAVIPILDPDIIIDVIPDLSEDTILDVIPILDPDVIVDVIPTLDDVTIVDVVPTLDDDTILKVIPIITPDIIPDIIQDLDIDTILKVIPIIDVVIIEDIIPTLTDAQLLRVVPILEKRFPPETVNRIERRLPRKRRRKFRKARKKRKVKRTKRPQPYEVRFRYVTGAREKEKVDAHTFTEAFIVGKEKMRIKLRPVEVEVEKLRGK